LTKKLKNLNFGLLRFLGFFKKPKKTLVFFEAIFQAPALPESSVLSMESSDDA